MKAYNYHAVPLRDTNDCILSLEDQSTYCTSKDDTSASKYRSAFTYNTGSLTLDVDYIKEDRVQDDAITVIFRCTVIVFCYLFLFGLAPLTLWFYIKKIASNERVVVFRLGRLQPVRRPGLTCFLPWIDRWKTVDVRMRQFAIPPQQIIMADGAIIEVGAEIRYRIYDVIKSVLAVRDFESVVRQLGQTSMVTVLQSETLSEFKRRNENVAAKLQVQLNSVTQPWGLEVSCVMISCPRVIQESKERSPLEFLMSSLQPSIKLPSNVDSLVMQKIHDVPKDRCSAVDVRDIMKNTVFPSLKEHNFGSSDDGVVYKLVVTGSCGGTFWFDTKTGNMADGDMPIGFAEAHVMIKLQDSDFLQLAQGRLSVMQAYMMDRIEVTGDKRLLGNLSSVRFQ